MNWQPYVRASWELVMESEGKVKVYLQQEIEAYLVHMMARTFTDPSIPPDIIALEFANAKTKGDYQRIGDSCLFIDAWDVKRAKLVNRDYYQQMGQIAYSSASLKDRPADQLLESVAENFAFISRVLRGVRL
jgi:hypothetical protein